MPNDTTSAPRSTSWPSGTYVRNRLTGVLGRIHYRFGGICPYSDSDLKRMSNSLGDNPMRFVNARWYQLLEQNDGRNCYMPEDLLEEVEPFQLNHREGSYYFADHFVRVQTDEVRRVVAELPNFQVGDRVRQTGLHYTIMNGEALNALTFDESPRGIGSTAVVTRVNNVEHGLNVRWEDSTRSSTSYIAMDCVELIEAAAPQPVVAPRTITANRITFTPVTGNDWGTVVGCTCEMCRPPRNEEW